MRLGVKNILNIIE